MRPITYLLKLVRFSPWYFAATVLFAAMVFLLIPLPVGLAAKAFFDALARTGLNPWTAIAVIVALQSLDLFASPLLGNPWNAVQQKSQVLIQRNLMAASLRGYGRHGLTMPVGEAISRFTYDPAVTADGLDALADLIGRSMFAAGAAYLMWRIHPVMTVALLVPLLLTSVIAHVLGDRNRHYHSESQGASAKLTGFLGELLGSQLAVKVAGAADNAVAHLGRLGENRQRAALRSMAFGEVLDSIHYHLVSVAIGVVLLIGAQDIRAGTFSVGDFALFVVFLDELMFLPTEVGRLINALQRIGVSMKRANELVPTEPPSELVAPAPVYLKEEPPSLPVPAPRRRLERLEVRNLTCNHHDGTPGISDVSFTLERGSFTVVTGRVGSGKSTLLQTLLGLIDPQGGEILWNGGPVTDPATFFVPPTSAYTPQVPRLFSRTLRENILLGQPEDPERLQAAVWSAVLESDIAALGQREALGGSTGGAVLPPVSNGLDTVVGPRGVKLSGGQVQRAAAARMFVRHAELLVFDDLSSALDAETEAELWRRLFASNSDATCLVVSHRPAALRRADQVLVMEAGRLAFCGTYDELGG